jgi:hypothetical protein
MARYNYNGAKVWYIKVIYMDYQGKKFENMDKHTRTDCRDMIQWISDGISEQEM